MLKIKDERGSKFKHRHPAKGNHMVFVDLNLGKTCLNPHAKQYLDKSLKIYRSVCMTKMLNCLWDSVCWASIGYNVLG